MHAYIIVVTCLLAAICTITSIFFLKPIAHRIGLVDIPGGRKTHTKHTPLIGGIAMYIGFCIATIALNHSLIQSLAMLSGTAILIIIGVMDDLYEVRKRVRFLGQALATAILVTFGHLSVDKLGNLFFTGFIDLSTHPLTSFLITLIAVMAFINAVNMIDGLDGLAGLLAFGQCCFLAFIAVDLAYYQIAYFLFILMALLAAYLTFNLALPWRKQASIFMGDAGSTFVAFLIAWFAVALCQKVLRPEHFGSGYNLVTILWILGYPLYDLLAVMFSRLKNRKSPATPGRDHFHHLLADLKIPGTAITWIIFAFSLCLGLAGILLAKWHITEAWQLVCFVSTFIVYLSLSIFLKTLTQI